MYLEIVSPEVTLFSGEVTSVVVPGVSGEFEMLNSHAPLVSILKEGEIKISGDIVLEDEVVDKFNKKDGKTTLSINSATLEINDNKIIILAD